MNVRHVYQWCVVGTLLVLGLGFGLNEVVSAPPPTPAPPVPANAEQGVQVLARGPVHEAFAETVTYNPEPGVVASKTPPAAIEEVPPAQRPAGTNVAWIPGYWSWDDERNDFLWVSGVWRALPPGRQWVPGYWGKSRKAFNGLPAIGPMPRPPRLNIYRSHPRASKSVLALPQLQPTKHGCPVAGFGKTTAMLGDPVFGQRCSRIGFGFPPITFRRPAATSSSTATGITPSADAACCSRPCILVRTYMGGEAFPTRRRR